MILQENQPVNTKRRNMSKGLILISDQLANQSTKENNEIYQFTTPPFKENSKISNDMETMKKVGKHLKRASMTESESISTLDGFRKTCDSSSKLSLVRSSNQSCSILNLYSSNYF